MVLGDSLQQYSKEDRTQEVENIAACVLYDHLDASYKYPDKFGRFIFTTRASRHEISSIQQPRNLSVFISGFKNGTHKKYKEFADKNVQAFDEDIYVLKVTFYRPDIMDEYLQYNFCSTAFPFVSNKDLLNRLVTSALERCLRQEFSDQSE